MPDEGGRIQVLAADVSQGDLLVHFSDESSVLFRAQFLSDVREQDSNVEISNEPEEQPVQDEGSAPKA